MKRTLLMLALLASPMLLSAQSVKGIVKDDGGNVIGSIGFSDRNWRLPLFRGCRFYECEIDPKSDDFQSVSGEIVENRLKPGILGIKNCSPLTWNVKFPDGVFYNIAPGKGFPIWSGLEIDFGEVKAKI